MTTPTTTENPQGPAAGRTEGSQQRGVIWHSWIWAASVIIAAMTIRLIWPLDTERSQIIGDYLCMLWGASLVCIYLKANAR